MQSVLIDDRRIHVDFSQSVSKLHKDWITKRTGGNKESMGGFDNLTKRTRYREGDGENKDYDLVFDTNKRDQKRYKSTSSRDEEKRDDDRRRDDRRGDDRRRDDRRRDDRRGHDDYKRDDDRRRDTHRRDDRRDYDRKRDRDDRDRRRDDDRRRR